MSWSEDIEPILSRGISLFEFGHFNWALDKKQALDALDEIEKLGVPMLGGDVYEMIDGIPQPKYDNWYCERKEGELQAAYTIRSIAHSRRYIESYRNPSGRETFFILGPDDELKDQDTGWLP